MSTWLVTRIFRQAGCPLPPQTLVRTFVHCPRERLIRAVAWYARARIADEPSKLLGHVRLVMRGWDDVYAALTLPGESQRADIERPVPRRALVIRAARAGRGWKKEPLPTVGPVRVETELAVAWLSRAVGCILHEDCAANPELGAACYEG